MERCIGKEYMKYTRLTDSQSVINAITSLKGSVCLDTETDSLDPHKAHLIDVQMSTNDPEHVVCFSAELAHNLTLLSKSLTYVAQNYAYDVHVLYRHGLDLRDRYWEDTMLMCHLVDENVSSSLSENVKKLWGDSYKDVFWEKYSSYEEAPQAERDEYACKDVYYTHKWWVMLWGKLEEEQIPDTLVAHIHDLSAVLLDTSIEGILVDRMYLETLGAKLSTELATLQPQMRSCVEWQVNSIEMGEWVKNIEAYKTEKGKMNAKRPVFSFDSTKQLQHLLYSRLQLEVQRNEKTKAPSTDEASLRNLEGQHPLIPLLLEYREKSKILNTYIQGTLERIDYATDRIYPGFRVNGTATGRISHSNPNLGQLPRKGGIRAIYRPDDLYSFVSADYSQLEICLAAHFTHDANLLAIVREGASQHDITANSLAISRNDAKRVNFAMMYGCSAYKIHKLLGVSIPEGEYLWKKYWDTYIGVKKLMDECASKVDSGLPIVTPYGRKRRFPKSEEKRPVWDKAYRQAFNALIQGTGADITSEALYLVDAQLKEKNIGRALLSVHDEILVRVKDTDVSVAKDILKHTMEGVGKRLQLIIDLKVEVSEGMKRWED